MSIVEGVLVALVTAVALALGALLVYRPWRKTQRRLRGHEVTIHVEVDLRRMDIPAGVEAPWTFWVAGDPEPPAAPMWGNADWADWSRAHGGHDVRSSVIQVTVQGAGEGPLAIDPPELVGHVVTVPQAGTVHGPEGLGGNGIHSRRFIFTLDGERVTREYLDDPEGRPPAFGLAQGETQRLIIVIKVADGMRHQWAIDLPVMFAGRRQILKVRRTDGSPFVTYGGAGHPVRMLVDGAWMTSPPSPH